MLSVKDTHQIEKGQNPSFIGNSGHFFQQDTIGKASNCKSHFPQPFWKLYSHPHLYGSFQKNRLPRILIPNYQVIKILIKFSPHPHDPTLMLAHKSSASLEMRQEYCLGLQQCCQLCRLHSQIKYFWEWCNFIDLMQ